MDHGIVDPDNVAMNYLVAFGNLLLQLPFFAAMQNNKIPINLFLIVFQVFTNIITSRILYGYWLWDPKDQKQFEQEMTESRKVDMDSSFNFKSR